MIESLPSGLTLPVEFSLLHPEGSNPVYFLGYSSRVSYTYTTNKVNI